MDLDDFATVPPSGILYSKINPDDDVVCTTLISENVDLVLYSDSKALRIPSKDVVLLKRNTVGTLGMGGQHGPMEGMSIIYTDEKNPSKYIVVVTEAGKVNKFLVSGFTRSQRNKAGSKVIDLGRGDRIHSLFAVTDDNTISILSTSGQLDVPVKDIPLGSSVSKGMKIFSGKTNMVIKTEMK